MTGQDGYPAPAPARPQFERETTVHLKEPSEQVVRPTPNVTLTDLGIHIDEGDGRTTLYHWSRVLKTTSQLLAGGAPSPNGHRLEVARCSSCGDVGPQGDPCYVCPEDSGRLYAVAI